VPRQRDKQLHLEAFERSPPGNNKSIPQESTMYNRKPSSPPAASSSPDRVDVIPESVLKEMELDRDSFYIERVFTKEIKAYFEYNIHRNTALRIIDILLRYPTDPSRTKNQMLFLLQRIKERCVILIHAETKGWNYANILKDFLNLSSTYEIPLTRNEIEYCKDYVSSVNEAVQQSIREYELRLVRHFQCIHARSLPGRVMTDSLNRHIKTSVFHFHVYEE
jgi:hypothetical protein